MDTLPTDYQMMNMTTKELKQAIARWRTAMQDMQKMLDDAAAYRSHPKSDFVRWSPKLQRDCDEALARAMCYRDFYHAGLQMLESYARRIGA